MKKQFFLIGSVVLIGIVVCVSVWFFLLEHKERKLQEQSHLISSRQHKEETTENRKVLQKEKNPDKVSMPIEERMQRAKSQMMSIFSEEQLAAPETQRMFAVMGTPEFSEFWADAHATGYEHRKWNDFWESQGFPVKREYPEVFRHFFPTGELEDYEPEMRLKLAKLFLAAKLVDLADPEAAASQRLKVMSEFRKERSNLGWFLGRFGEEWDGAIHVEREGARRNTAREWVSDIQRNAASIVADAEATGAPESDTGKSASSWDLSSVIESPSVSSGATMEENPSAAPSAIDALETPTIPKPETDTAVTPVLGLTDGPKTLTNLPTVEGLETSLKEHFSSERFDRAMSILERYGPEEGLRRLKESDPEVAEQVEQHRNRKEISK